jgi:hypothetical protein
VECRESLSPHLSCSYFGPVTLCIHVNMRNWAPFVVSCVHNDVSIETRVDLRCDTASIFSITCCFIPCGFGFTTRIHCHGSIWYLSLLVQKTLPALLKLQITVTLYSSVKLSQNVNRCPRCTSTCTVQQLRGCIFRLLRVWELPG